MGERQRYEAEWEGLHLIVEARPAHWQAFVYDPGECEILYTAGRLSLDAAKCAAIEFAAVMVFGQRHDLTPEVISTMLLWEPQ